MRFALLSAVAVAGLTGSSSAFLLPPQISSADIDTIKSLSFEDAVASGGRVMEIDCPGCPVATNIHSKLPAVDSVLKLNFTIEQQNSLDHLLLNGRQIYPMDPRSHSFMQPLMATQMVQTQDKTWAVAATPELGYSLSIRHPVPYSEKDQLDLVSVHIDIVEVAEEFLTGIPGVEIKLLNTPSGKLMIADAEIIASKSLSSTSTGNSAQCSDLLCQWRAIVAAKLAQLKAGVKGCGSHMSRPHTRPAHPEHHGHHGGHGEHGQGRPHHSSGPDRTFRHHRHRHGAFTRFLRGIVLHILIPILIGIMFGITASLVGMVVGHVIIFTWRLFFRRNTSCYQKVLQAEATDLDVKNFLHGPPPQYHDAQADEKTAE